MPGVLSSQFNDANRAWIRSRISAQRKARREGLATTPPSHDADRVIWQWTQRGAHYLRNVPERERVSIQGGEMTITRRGWDALMTTPMRAVAEAMDRHAAAVALEIWMDAPVKSGLYRSRWALRWYVTGDRLVVALENDAPYARIGNHGKTRLSNQAKAKRRMRDAAFTAGTEVLDLIRQGGDRG